MHRLPVSLLRRIAPGTWNLEELAIECAIGSLYLQEVLSNLSSQGVGFLTQGEVSFKPGDKLRASLLYLRSGMGVEEVSSQLDWRAFEGLAGEVLAAHSYDVRYNLRLKESRREIDVVGLKAGLGVAVDCKHWSRTIGHSALSRAAKAQVSRAKALLSANGSGLRISSAVPVIITLHSEGLKIVHQVPIVCVSSFSNFLIELDGALKYLRVVS